MGGADESEARWRLVARLRQRRDEIERATLARVYDISDPRAVGDPDYLTGLRDAVAAALDFGLDGMEPGEGRIAPVPSALVMQVRRAARNRVSLDDVLRRYLAGYALLGDFVMQQAVADGVSPEEIRPLVRHQAALFDRVIHAVSTEYERERASGVESARERRAERIRRLLDGEPIDTGEFDYDFEAWHLGLVAAGPGADELVSLLVATTGRRPLLTRDGDETVWAWLEGRRLGPAAVAEIERVAPPDRTVLAIGEPARGVAGWRQTHLQARAVLPVARRLRQRRARYADLALLTSVLRDDLAAAFLRDRYLASLAGERDGGETLRRTLRAYFAAERNISSAAAALGVKRHTVASRLRASEQLFGRSLSSCAAEVELALRLDDLDRAG